MTVYCDLAGGVDPKPATEPFDRALAALAVPPAATAYVWDDHSADVVGAHEAGLQSVWVPPDRPHESHLTDPDPEPTHRLESLTDLPTVL